MLVWLLLPAWDAGAQQLQLRANLQVAVSDPFYGASLARFKDEVERNSRNAISIVIRDEGQWYRDDEVVAAVMAGAVDIGIAGADRYVGAVPAAGILNQPFLFNFQGLRDAAAAPGSELRRLIDDAILARTGVRVLWWQSLGQNVVYSKGRRDVADPAWIKLQRVGVPSRLLAEFVGRCGGTASVLPVEHLRDRLEDGTLDMAMADLAALEADELWDVTDTITFTEHAPVEYLLIFNEKVWKSLTAGQRAIIRQAATEVELETRDILSEFEARAYALASIKGMQVRELTPDDVAEWRACSADMLLDYMDKNGEIAQRLMSAYSRLRLDPCCAAAPGSAAFTRR